MALKPNTPGAVIGAGELLLGVPDVEKLVIDVQMSPMDIDRIQGGQKLKCASRCSKTAIRSLVKLIKISADSMTNESTGSTYYEAKGRATGKIF